jgi:predicted permease
MPILRRVASLFRNLFRRSEIDRELDAELQATLDLLIEEKEARGLSQTEARRIARIELGGLEHVRTSVRDARAGASLDRLAQDLRGAIRWLRRAPGFASAAILIMSFGLGAVTTVSAVATAILFAPPAGIPASDRLVGLDRLNLRRPWAPTTMSYAEYQEYRWRTELLEVAGSQARAMVVRVGAQTERVATELATANYFDVLGIRVSPGRTFTKGQDVDEAIASRRLLREFGIAGDGLGTVLQVSGESFVIVGVAPDDFVGTELLDRGADLWLPAAARRRLNPALSEHRATPLTDLEDRGWRLVGRLRDGVDVSAAAVALRATARELEELHPDTLRGLSVALRPGLQLRDRDRLQIGVPLGITLASVSLLLLIGCANVANLTLARTIGRSKEMALRRALGASRRRVVRQLLTETALLATIAAIGGIILAPWMLAALSVAMPAEAHHLLLANVTLADWRVALLVVTVTGVVALVAGVLPAVQGGSVALVSAMKQGEPSGPGARRARRAFVTAQVALAVVLLSTCGVLVRALQAAYAVSLGYETRGLVLATVDPPQPDELALPELAIRIQAELARQPDLSHASIAAQPPLQRGAPFVVSFTRVDVAGELGGDVTDDVLQTQVGPGYFETLGLPVLRGRGISAQDTSGAEPVVVVNDAVARQRWQDENPIGTLIRLGHEQAPRRVVGVVAQAQHIGLAGRYAEGLYLPLTQATSTLPQWVVLLRPKGDLTSAMRSAQRALDVVGPPLLLYDARPMEEQFGRVVFPQRTMAMVTGTVGLIALLLTAAGLTATVSFVVAQRTREIGIRMALGARRRQVIYLVMRQGLSAIVIGGAIGLTLSAGTAVVLGRTLAGVNLVDPVVPLAVCALLSLVAFAAMLVPARDAATVDPSEAFRAE